MKRFKIVLEKKWSVKPEVFEARTVYEKDEFVKAIKTLYSEEIKADIATLVVTDNSSISQIHCRFDEETNSTVNIYTNNDTNETYAIYFNAKETITYKLHYITGELIFIDKLDECEPQTAAEILHLNSL